MWLDLFELNAFGAGIFGTVVGWVEAVRHGKKQNLLPTPLIIVFLVIGFAALAVAIPLSKAAVESTVLVASWWL